MKLRIERAGRFARDVVVIEADGTIFSCFERTGFLKSVARTRFSSGASATTAAFLISEDRGETHTAKSAPFGLMFVSEVEGVEKVAVVERFATREAADVALAALRSVVRRHIGKRRMRAAWKSLLVWLGAPLLTAIIGMAAVRYLDSHNGAMEMLGAMMRNQAGPAAPAPPPSPDAARAVVPPSFLLPPSAAVSSFGTNPAGGGDVGAQRAAMLQSPDMTSIHFGRDNLAPDHTLYVFADPECPACRRFEAHMDDLAKDYSIYVLPVAYQSGSVSAARKILCASDRNKAWATVMGSLQTGQAVSGDECERANAGIRANMQAFDALGFAQTPRVVSGTGYVFAAGATARDIRSQSAVR